MATIPVILRCDEVSRLDRSERRTRNPATAMVYTTSDGRVEVLDGGRPVTLGEQMSGRYRYRYEVDMSDHRRTVELRSFPPPARGGVHHFTTVVTVGFRVTDPAQVVRRNVRDALLLVTDHLMTVYRDITVSFPIEAAKDAEDAVNARFRHGEVIDGCIELYLCRARLEPDPEAVHYLRAAQRAALAEVADVARHGGRTAQAHRDNELERIAQSGRLSRREVERRALAGRRLDPEDLIALHLETNPTDTASALGMAAQVEDGQTRYRAEDEDRRWQRFEFMTQHRLVQPVDVAEAREQVLAGLSGPVVPLAARATVDDWDDPLPEDDRQSGEDPEPGSRSERGGSERGDGPVAGEPVLPGLIPIYLVVDETAPLTVDALTAGLGVLIETLVREPEIGAVVRLAVVGYAEDAAVRMGLRTVRAGMPVPPLAPSRRPRRLGTLFALLADLIPGDAQALKIRTPSLRRPQVLVWCGGAPTDEESWAAAHRALVDRDSQRYAPDLIACGTGGVRPGTLLEIATRPDLAFVAPTLDLNSAAHEFCAFATRRILEYGRAVLDGDQNTTISGPDGYRPAVEIAFSPAQEG